MTISPRKIVFTAALAALSVGAAKADVEIEYWQYYFEQRVNAMEVLIENFEAANPGITVKMTTFPYADYRTKVAAAIPAGEGPDVVQLFYGWLNEYAEAGLIQPLPAETFPAERIEAEFYPMVGAMKRDGEYWALPTAVRSLALFYNTRILEDAGVEVPTTLEELLAAAEATTQRDGAGNITSVGIAAGMNAQDHHWWREILVRQFGGTPYTDDYTSVTYNDEAGRAALEWYTNLAAPETGVTTFGFMDEPQAAFKGGRAAFMVDGSFRIGALNDTRGLKWGVTELPVGPNGEKSNYSSYWVNAITSSAEAEEYEASVKFMEYITSDEAMEIWLETVGELPAKPSAGAAATDDPVFGPFIRGLEYAHTTIFADEAAQRGVMMDTVSRIQLEDASIEDALATAAEAEQKILDDFYGSE